MRAFLVRKLLLTLDAVGGVFYTITKPNGESFYSTDELQAIHSYIIDYVILRGMANNVTASTYNGTFCQVGLLLYSVELFRHLLHSYPNSKWLIFQGGIPDVNLTEQDMARLAQGHVELFSHDRSQNSRQCDVIIIGLDSTGFSWHRYQHVVRSVDMPFILFNRLGCTPSSRVLDDDNRNCRYMDSQYFSSLCGVQMDEKKNTILSIPGIDEQQLFHLPNINNECGEVVCVCFGPDRIFKDHVYQDICPHQDFRGQWFQDWFVYNNFFRHDPPAASEGIYIDIGSMDPYLLSNTVFFDQCLGWMGLCVEPSPKHWNLLNNYRTCQVIRNCVWNETTTKQFHKSQEVSRFVSFGEAFNSSDDDSYEAKCRPLHEILLEVGLLGKTIHVLNVDTEGAELAIFRDFPFPLFDIKVATVEVSQESAMGIDNIFFLNGFVKVAFLGKDAVYVDPAHFAKSFVANQGKIHFPEFGFNTYGMPAERKRDEPFHEYQRRFGVTDGLLREANLATVAVHA